MTHLRPVEGQVLERGKPITAEQERELVAVPEAELSALSAEMG